MIQEALNKLLLRKNLQRNEARRVMDTLMEGQATQAQIGGFLIAMRMKGETADEIAGAAESMRSHATAVEAPAGSIDTCGTGGDGKGTFNASTAAALIVAGAGVPVAKHGNKAMSSSCGSADLLEAMGVKLDPAPKIITKCIREAGIGFMFAQALHPAMKHVGGPRRELGTRTLFNVLGPIANPAKVRLQVLGVADPTLLDLMAGVLKKMGTKRAWLVHGVDGTDEISLTGKTQVLEVRAGRIRKFSLVPKDFGMKKVALRSLRGGSVAANAAMLRAVLGGKRGPLRNFCVANAAAALRVSGKASNLKQAVALAEESIDSQRAAAALEKLVRLSHSH